MIFSHRKSTLGMEIMVGSENQKMGGKYYQAEHYVEHDDFKLRNMRRPGDIAVIRTIGKIDFNEKVQPIELSSTEPKDGASASE